MARRFRFLFSAVAVMATAIMTLGTPSVSATAYATGFDAVFEQAMIDRGYDSGAIDGQLPLANIQKNYVA